MGVDRAQPVLARRTDLTPALRAATADRVGYAVFFAHNERHRELYRSNIGLDTDSAAGAELRTLLESQTRTALTHLEAEDHEFDVDAATAFLVGGLLAVVARWLEGRGPTDPRTLADALTALTPSWVKLAPDTAQPPAISLQVDPPT